MEEKHGRSGWAPATFLGPVVRGKKEKSDTFENGIVGNTTHAATRFICIANWSLFQNCVKMYLHYYNYYYYTYHYFVLINSSSILSSLPNFLFLSFCLSSIHHPGSTYEVKQSYSAKVGDEVSAWKGDKVLVLSAPDNGWWIVKYVI